jgi:ABC-type nitrate/sulfonate/bicarbonate transport system substrate-binding protein
MTEVAANPDVLVGFAAGIDMATLEIKENPDNKMQTLENVPKGALVVMLVDPKTRQPVWVGEALANVQKKLPSKDVKARLKYAVKEMFDQMKR